MNQEPTPLSAYTVTDSSCWADTKHCTCCSQPLGRKHKLGCGNTPDEAPTLAIRPQPSGKSVETQQPNTEGVGGSQTERGEGRAHSPEEWPHSSGRTSNGYRCTKCGAAAFMLSDLNKLPCAPQVPADVASSQVSDTGVQNPQSGAVAQQEKVSGLGLVSWYNPYATQQEIFDDTTGNCHGCTCSGCEEEAANVAKIKAALSQSSTP